MILFILLTSSFYTAVGQCEVQPKPFQFRCYDNDVCTWPQQYCSSERHELRCIPCLTSVCKLTSPPHQCRYNCSLRGQNEDDIHVSKTDEKLSKEGSSHIAVIEIVSTFCVILLFVAMFLAVNICKLKKRMKKKEDKIEEMEALITSSKYDQDTLVRHEDEEREKKRLNVDETYAKKKFNHVPPTKDSSSPGNYKPTTYMDTSPAFS